MSDRKFTCPHCKQHLDVPGELLGQTVQCPTCKGQMTPSAAAHGQSVQVAPPEFQSAPSKGATQVGPLFLYVPIARLIVMSIVSLGLYEAYWIYRNWRYVKERDNLNIKPFWRGVFCIFYCHSLLRRIHEDKGARVLQVPSFTPGSLALGWVFLRIAANAVSRLPGDVAIIVAAFIPSFMCLVPVQNYINAVSRRQNPSQPHYRWSSGHVVCLIIGIIFWSLYFISLGIES